MGIFKPNSIDTRSVQEIVIDSRVEDLVKMIEDLNNGSLRLPQGFADILTELNQTIAVQTESGVMIQIELPTEKKKIVLEKLEKLGYIKK